MAKTIETDFGITFQPIWNRPAPQPPAPEIVEAIGDVAPLLKLVGQTTVLYGNDGAVTVSTGGKTPLAESIIHSALEMVANKTDYRFETGSSVAFRSYASVRPPLFSTPAA